MLQIGNFHVVALVLSVLAMVAFERNRLATGGTLLAVTNLSKISPGILGIVLLVQRRFRSAAWAAGVGGLLLGLCTLWSGTDLLKSFVTYALPRLSTGAAFPHIPTEAGIATNLSPFGIAFKLPLFGIHLGEPWAVGAIFARIYTVFLVILAVIAARRAQDRLGQAVTWMSLLTLGALQSPFSPGYAAISLLWATTLLASRVDSLRGAMVLVLIWVLSTVTVPDLRLELMAIQSLVQTFGVIGASVWLLLRRSPDPIQLPPVSIEKGGSIR